MGTGGPKVKKEGTPSIKRESPVPTAGPSQAMADQYSEDGEQEYLAILRALVSRMQRRNEEQTAYMEATEHELTQTGQTIRAVMTDMGVDGEQEYLAILRALVSRMQRRNEEQTVYMEALEHELTQMGQTIRAVMTDMGVDVRMEPRAEAEEPEQQGDTDGEGSSGGSGSV
jgi:phage host-nuclease inhibitor protein Gam